MDDQTVVQQATRCSAEHILFFELGTRPRDSRLRSPWFFIRLRAFQCNLTMHSRINRIRMKPGSDHL